MRYNLTPYIQPSEDTCGPAAAVVIARHLGVDLPFDFAYDNIERIQGGGGTWAQCIGSFFQRELAKEAQIQTILYVRDCAVFGSNGLYHEPEKIQRWLEQRRSEAATPRQLQSIETMLNYSRSGGSIRFDPSPQGIVAALKNAPVIVGGRILDFACAQGMPVTTNDANSGHFVIADGCSGERISIFDTDAVDPVPNYAMERAQVRNAMRNAEATGDYCCLAFERLPR